MGNSTNRGTNEVDDLKSEVQTIIAAVTAKDPFLGILLKRTWIYLSTEQSAPAWTDGLNIYINPELFSRYDTQERAYIMIHELLHIVLKHVPRSKPLLSKYGNIDTIINVAADAKVNQYADSAGFRMPRGAITPRTLHEALGLDEDFVEEASMEELVEALVSIFHKAEREVKPQWSDIASKSSSTCGESNKEVLNEGDEKDKEVVAGDEVERRIEKKVAEAYYAAKSIGKTPGYAERLVKEVLEPEVDWRSLLRAAMSKMLGSNVWRTWHRVSRKCDLLPGKERYGIKKIVVMVDTSGSIGSEELQRFISEIYGIARERARVVVVPWDAEVYPETIIKSPSEIGKIKLKGGGGTMIKPALEYVARKHNDADVIVIMSDWMIGDLDDAEVQNLLKKFNDRLIAVTTVEKPPKFIKRVIELKRL